jgi:uncharacterized protein (DUF849 family)
MGRKVVITCALNGGGDVKSNPAIPTTPKAIAAAAIDAARAGAAVAHIHARDPNSGAASMDVAHYREAVMRIRDSGVDLILNLTTGPGGTFYPAHPDPTQSAPGTTLTTTDGRIRHVEELKPELCSLSMGSNNKGDPIYINPERHIRDSLERFRAAGVKPEFEIFDTGHIMYTHDLIEKGLIDSPAVMQICLGLTWSAPATPETLMLMKNLLPSDSVWFAFGKGLMMFPVVALTVILGGHIRVGLEDTPWLCEGTPAPSNTALVEKAVTIVSALDAEPASPQEARRLLGLRPGA